MTDQETSVANFFETDLTAEMGPTDLTATVASTSGLTSPTFLVIEPDTAAQREVILFDGTFTGTTFVTSTINNRYLSGSGAGSGITHPVGSKVRSAPLAQHLDDLNDRVDADAAAFASHGSRHALAGADPLPADSVDTTQLAADAVTTAKINTGAVDTNQLADLAVTLSKIENLTIGSAKLGTSSVTTAKIAPEAVTAAKAGGDLASGFEVDNSTEVASQALTASFADVASVTLNIPAGWGSWKCEVWASFGYVADAVGPVTASMSALIRIDGTDQQALSGLSTSGNSDVGAGAVGGRRTGITTTGSRSVSLRASESGDDVTIRDVYLYARAVRTS